MNTLEQLRVGELRVEGQPVIAKEAVKRCLEDEVWNAADRIGRPSCYHMLQNFTDAEMAGYAHGVHTALVCVAEELPLGVLDTKQLDAALGERLHRKGGGKLQCRRLNNLVTEIRAARCALIDDYQPVNYEGFTKPMQKRIWHMERQGVETDAESLELQLVQKEFRALCDLNCHKVGDRQWQLSRSQRQEKALVAA
jgi:hypothetical protein